MPVDVYLIAKLVLLLYVWGLITLFTLVILRSRKFYFLLKEIETLCMKKRREFIYNYLPLISNLAKRNELIRKILNLNKINVRDLVISVFPLFFQIWIFNRWIKSGFELTKKALR